MFHSAAAAVLQLFTILPTLSTLAAVLSRVSQRRDGSAYQKGIDSSDYVTQGSKEQPQSLARVKCQLGYS